MTSVSSKPYIAQRFSRAATSYDQAAHLQQRVGHQLLRYVPVLPYATIADIGAGTGYFCPYLQALNPIGDKVYAVDLAVGMLQRARQLQRVENCIQADLEHLPFAPHSIDLIFSNLAIQWSDHLSHVMRSVHHSLRAQGVFAFSTVLEGSLNELATVWADAKQPAPINTFRDAEAYRTALMQQGFEVLTLHAAQHVCFYPNLYALLREFKALGVGHVKHSLPSGLHARSRLAKLEAAYEPLRQPRGLPLSWEILYVVAQPKHG